MSNITHTPPTESRTKITFDLAAELTPQELAQFEESAKAAGAATLTEHFVKLTLANYTQPERSEA